MPGLLDIARDTQESSRSPGVSRRLSGRLPPPAGPFLGGRISEASARDELTLRAPIIGRRLEVDSRPSRAAGAYSYRMASVWGAQIRSSTSKRSTATPD